ncbi:MAG: flagellar biosynthesis protein FlhB [Melioribacteraceae bacterium]|nr:flagellar biosynthesis protein FlhB [Melioribacteraceae bacterium]MCF8355144.1 flagellar biosynthesis protein FlhB [Melioribacteraceae bacterium]MCF8392473.1 flagellar biosynthesis protein FlhB [Melioribacteraceae bacterium]MCF8418384.1 flagellar biosynthesis protein FlhB [Melioribacteraceae bacterium]
MAENQDGQEKTEQATGKKLQDSRDEGKAAKSMELNSVAVFTAGLLSLFFAKDFISSQLYSIGTMVFSSIHSLEINLNLLRMIALKGFLFFLMTTSPIFLGLIIAAFAATYGQIGFKISPKAMSPKFSKLDPIKGIKNLLFSSKSFIEIGKAALKLFIIAFFVYLVLADTVLESVELVKFSVSEILGYMISTLISFLWKVALVYLLFAFIDFIYQKRKHGKDLMMTKQEVKDENKQTEGDPQIKSEIKSKQFEMAKRRMMQEVPSADVIITNPTHYAVALKYEIGGKSAPVVVAKGVDLVAQKIKKIAIENNIPLHEDVQLARALFKVCDIGDTIPENLFKAVAQVLAFIYKLKKAKKKSIV